MMTWITTQLNRRVLVPVAELTIGDMLLIVIIVKIIT